MPDFEIKPSEAISTTTTIKEIILERNIHSIYQPGEAIWIHILGPIIDYSHLLFGSFFSSLNYILGKI